ncbi:acyl-CoA dehydrogenase [Streptomyces sp. NPDC001508]|uniref:acyl-CoA dehydrogenase family protein n=1 Tax=Streptomyces sp. NPDC001508 TaxID=3154656 RepID=UPI00332DF82D
MPDRATARPADARQFLAAFAHSGHLRRLYPHATADRLDPRVLRELLACADTHREVGPVLSLCVHLATAVPLLAEGARTTTATTYLEAAVRGERLLALAATDEGAGSDPTALTTTVGPGPRGLVLNGRKRWVTSAATADAALVLARRTAGRHFTSFSWILVPLDAPGVSVRPADTDLFRGSGLGHIALEGVELSSEYLVGRQGAGLVMFAKHLTVERLASAAWAIEVCRRTIEDTDQRLRERAVGGGVLRELSAVQQRLAECAVRVSALDALWRQTCDRIAAARDGTWAAVLKSASGLTIGQVLADCAQLQGADGFERGGVQSLRAEAAVFGIGGGTTEVTLGIVAEHLDSVLSGVRP